VADTRDGQRTFRLDQVADVVVVEADPWATRILATIPVLRVSRSDELPSSRSRVELEGNSHTAVVKQIAGLVSGLKVISPPSARTTLARIGTELLARYNDDLPASGTPV